MTTPSSQNDPVEDVHLARRGAKLILRSFKAQPLNHAIAMGGAILYSLSLVAFTRAISWATDTAIVPGLSESGVSWNVALAASGVVMGIAFLQGVGAAFRRYFLAVAEYRTEELWRSDLFTHNLEQPLATLRAHPAGRLIAHVDSDVNTAGMVLKPLAFALATIVLAVAGLASLFEIHLWFGLLALVLFPTLALLNQRFSNSVEQPAANVQEAVGDVTAVAHESFDGIMMVKTLGRQSEETERFRAQSENLRQRRLKVGRINTFYQPLLSSLPNIGALAMVVLGASMIDRGSISVGDLIGALTLLSVLALPVRIFAFFLQSMPPSVVALDRIDRFLAEDGRADAATNQTTEGLTSGQVLAFDDVQFAYPGEPVDEPLLNGLTFELRQGESVCLVGNTGSGKTTIAELASGLLNPTSGKVRRRRDETLYPVLQEAFLFDDSVSNNITMGSNLAESRIVGAAELAEAQKFISELPQGYETVIGERGVTLSGGQRQRVALTRALAHQPDVIVLDDATSAIDPVIEANILAALRQQSLTMLVIANRLSTIRLADRVLFLQNGAVAASGSHDELLKIPAYRSLVASQDDTAPVGPEATIGQE